MLVMSRQTGKSIVIADSVRVTVGLLDPETAELIIEDRGETTTSHLRRNERLVIDSVQVMVIVVDLREGPNGYKVRLGIEAPRDVPVHRSEIYDVIRGTGEDEEPM